jgi:hypothetical protein
MTLKIMQKKKNTQIKKKREWKFLIFMTCLVSLIIKKNKKRLLKNQKKREKYEEKQYILGWEEKNNVNSWETIKKYKREEKKVK